MRPCECCNKNYERKELRRVMISFDEEDEGEGGGSIELEGHDGAITIAKIIYACEDCTIKLFKGELRLTKKNKRQDMIDKVL